jgi:hypothetical protein
MDVEAGHHQLAFFQQMAVHGVIELVLRFAVGLQSLGFRPDLSTFDLQSLCFRSVLPTLGLQSLGFRPDSSTFDLQSLCFHSVSSTFDLKSQCFSSD